MEKTIQWGIKEIRELEFFVDEFSEPPSQFDFNYIVQVIPDVDHETVRMAVTAVFTKTGTREELLKGKVATVFQIKGLRLRQKTLPNGAAAVDLPDKFWATLLSITYSHARAILARSAAGTRFQHMLMPIINPDVEMKKIFELSAHTSGAN